VDLESVADELYAGSPDDFVAQRKDRAAAARAAGDRPLAKAITALRRPTRSAWLVNLLAFKAADEVTALLDLGAALADAQRRSSGDDLRRLSKERHTVLNALSRRAVDLAADQGHSSSETARQEVTQTLQAALADPEVAALVKAGRVVQAASYGGFGPMDLGFALPAAEEERAADEQPAAAGESSDKPDETRTESPELTQARVAREQARQELQAAVEAAATAEVEAEAATAAADDLAEVVETLKGQLAEAEASEQEAGEAARKARKQLQQRQRALASAREALAEAEQTLADLNEPQ
jgi:hypothetical protein